MINALRFVYIFVLNNTFECVKITTTVHTVSVVSVRKFIHSIHVFCCFKYLITSQHKWADVNIIILTYFTSVWCPFIMFMRGIKSLFSHLLYQLHNAILNKHAIMLCVSFCLKFMFINIWGFVKAHTSRPFKTLSTKRNLVE